MTADGAATANGTADKVRLALVEQRVGNVECEMKELRDLVGGMNAKLTAILVSVATAALLLALNLVVNGVAP